MRRRRIIAGLLVAASLLAACGSAENVLNEVEDTVDSLQPDATPTDGTAAGDDGQPTGDDGGSADPGDGGDQGDGGGTSDDAGDDGQTGGGQDDGGVPATSTDDLGAVGANGRAMLRGQYADLIVEIDYQSGVTPDQNAVSHLLDIIRRYADKPAGVTLSGGNEFGSDRTQWTTSDLRATADANRQHYSDADTTVVYILYVRGGLYDDGQETNAIGVAHRASEIAVFPEKWSGGSLGALLGSDANVERSVLVHEWGHLLGLVNISYTSDIDHEDPEHPKHSSNRGSAMYWAIESTAIGQVFSGPPPDDFDDADRADIEGLKSGKY